jgi:hypothetical protein
MFERLSLKQQVATFSCQFCFSFLQVLGLVICLLCNLLLILGITKRLPHFLVPWLVVYLIGGSFRVSYWWVFRVSYWWLFPGSLIGGSFRVSYLSSSSLIGVSFLVSFWWVFPRLLLVGLFSSLFVGLSSSTLYMGLSASLIDWSFLVSYWWVFPRI